MDETQQAQHLYRGGGFEFEKEAFCLQVKYKAVALWECEIAYICSGKYRIIDPHGKKRIVINGLKLHTQIYLENISHIVCEDYVCTIYRVKGSEVCCVKPLSYFEDTLLPFSFCRINRHIIVNLSQIAIIEVEGRTHWVMTRNGVKLRVASRRWPTLKARFYEETFANDNVTFTD
ncbi:LytTR family transcriptional regulator DNA-binding domain-containing protein [Bacteroides heparinolyticus]|uniref:LytTR family transcriptional regulator DNA-binding domain-containing protein n=1 Tax=Prevotella heparinolytica TaxID=28113 RepID=UPI00359F6DE2